MGPSVMRACEDLNFLKDSGFHVYCSALSVSQAVGCIRQEAGNTWGSHERLPNEQGINRGMRSALRSGRLASKADDIGENVLHNVKP